MNAASIMLVTIAGFILAYFTYGRFIARKVFNLQPDESVPSRTLLDGRDYVPTDKKVLFGHHFASIAGTGPIVGPAIGIIWGWLPALLWIFLGSIIMGAVHDFGSLVISMRNQGRTLSDCTAKYIGPRVRYIFFIIIFLELLIVIAIFGLVIALIFARFPSSVLPVWLQIPIAITVGGIIAKGTKHAGWLIAAAVALMYVTIVLGHFNPLVLPAFRGIPPTGVWTLLLLVYAFVASILPVTTLMQPRDFINAWQLIIAMSLLFAGAIAAGITSGLPIVAPLYNPSPAGAPPMAPFLFITIACGAVSGFHSLVSSGTSSKQLYSSRDALFVGYGAMLTEGALATLVIVAVSAGIGLAYVTPHGVLSGTEAWQTHYASWQAVSGLGAKLDAVVIGAANMMSVIGIPETMGVVIMGVFIASFAGTTLDTATRIQRYVVTEALLDAELSLVPYGASLLRRILKALTNRYLATLFVVVTAGALAFATGADGKGALKLWPMFGGVNQLLAALALLVITNYLRRKGGYRYLFSAIPCVFMLVVTLWSVAINERNFIAAGNGLLAVINGLMVILAVWMAIESVFAFLRDKTLTPNATPN